MIVIGELINCTRKKITPAVEGRDTAFIQDLAKRQVEAGANYVDVNGGIAGMETECLTWLVETVQEAVEAPLSIDTPDAGAMRAALEAYKGKEAPLLNSLTAEKSSLEEKLPILKDHKCKVIALLMSDEGVPKSVEDRLHRASFLVDKLTSEGVEISDIYIDPCVLPVSAELSHGKDVLDSIEAIKTKFESVNTICGLSNVSFGLPLRKLLNQVYMVMALTKGLDAVIIDPLDKRMMAHITAAETLIGKDEYCMNYINAHRSGKLTLEG